MSNLDGPAHPKPVVIEEEEDKQPTKAAASEFHRQPPLLDMHYSPDYKMAKTKHYPETRTGGSQRYPQAELVT
jgi:hypothetical protein